MEQYYIKIGKNNEKSHDFKFQHISRNPKK